MQLQADPIIWYMRGNHSIGYGPMHFGTEVEVSTVPDMDYALWYGTTAANFGRRCNHCKSAARLVRLPRYQY